MSEADTRFFRVLWPHSYQGTRVPFIVPWAFLAPHEEWAQRNHGQTLERLNERGGLGLDEMVAIVEHRRWRKMGDAEMRERLAELMDEWARTHVSVAGATP